MDYFGQLVDDLTDISESIEASPASSDAGEVLKALQRVMVAAAKAERLRNARLQYAQSIHQDDHGVDEGKIDRIIADKAA